MLTDEQQRTFRETLKAWENEEDLSPGERRKTPPEHEDHAKALIENDAQPIAGEDRQNSAQRT